MRKGRRLAWLTAAALGGIWLAASGSAQSNAPLQALFDREWEWELAQDPIGATYLGETRYDDRWPDVSLAAFAARQAHREAVLKELAAIPRGQLSPADRTNYDVFKYQTEMAVEGYKYRYYLIRTNTYDGIQNSEQLIDAMQFRAVKDYENWIARLNAFPVYIDQNIELMREGLDENVKLPSVITIKVMHQLTAMTEVEPVESGFYRPFLNFPPAVGEADRARLAEAGEEAIRTKVLPALGRLLEFMEEDYSPVAYERAGWWQTSSGQDGYAYLARLHTTTNMGPESIHTLGLKEVARIRGEMEQIKRKVGFKGTLQEFFTYLRTDPQFFYTTGDELLTAYRALAKRIDPELVKISRHLPRMTYGVLPIPGAVAPNTTTAYANFPSADGSRPAYYFVNLYKPETRPKWEMLSLTLHEAVPGHCLQGSVAIELDMPAFRRNAGFTAYVEGWALYAESLGDEMGLYADDPYARFGQLTYQMWRAVRLVVDTGIHTMQWDRDRAIKYFMDNTAKTEQDVVNEIDRYISWPGQALAYKVGELKIWELRRKAEAALGSKFDVRDFNDVVLQTGAVPLNVLEERVNEWIREAGN